jgi:DNA-binding response OmpR family regulator
MADANQTAPHRLLAVEDDPDCSDLILRTALKSGYTGLAAEDALSLHATIRDWRPDVITLDLCLPNFDGMEVIGLIKEAGFAGHLIIISGQPEWIRDLTRKVASESGLNVPAQMSKPVNLRELHELLIGIRDALSAGHSRETTSPPSTAP